MLLLYARASTAAIFHNGYHTKTHPRSSYHHAGLVPQKRNTFYVLEDNVYLSRIYGRRSVHEEERRVTLCSPLLELVRDPLHGFGEFGCVGRRVGKATRDIKWGTASHVFFNKEIHLV